MLPAMTDDGTCVASFTEEDGYIRFERRPECHACDLNLTCRNVGILGEGRPGGILFVGIGPGQEEDASGRVFVGPSGRRLRSLCAIHAEGVPVAFCNLVGCRPSRNRPTRAQAVACWDRQGHGASFLEVFRPKCIVALGEIVAGFLMFSRTAAGIPVSKMRGSIREHDGMPIVVTYHPSATLRRKTVSARGAQFLQALIEDIRLAARVCRGEVQRNVAFVRSKEMPPGPSVVIDTETTHLRPWRGSILDVGVVDPDSPMSPRIFPRGRGFPDERPAGWQRILGWNLIFDAQWLPEWVMDVPWEDGILIHGLLFPEVTARSLKVVGPSITGVVYRWTKSVPEMTPAERREYLSMDLYQTAISVGDLLPRLKESPAARVYPFVERLARRLAGLSRRGIRVDVQRVYDMLRASHEKQSSIIRRLREIAESVGGQLRSKDLAESWSFSVSRKDAIDVIYERLKLPPHTSPKGGLSLSSSARAELTPIDRTGFLGLWGDLIFEQSKAVGTYLRPLVTEGWIDGNGLAHPVPHLVRRERVGPESSTKGAGGGTVTGRVVWTDPPLQVFPKEFRQVIVPRDPQGWIASVDLSQIEPRCLVDLTREESMMEAFNAGQDFYRHGMAVALSIRPDEVTDKIRRAGKTIMLAILYGAGPWKVREIFRAEAGMDVSLPTCEDLIRRYRRGFPKIVGFAEEVRAKTLGGIPQVSPTGRVRRFDIGEDAEMACREAINWHIQSYASDVNHAILLGFQDRSDLFAVAPTVHDANTFEASSVHTDPSPIREELSAHYEKAHSFIREFLGVSFETRISYKIEVGRSWQ